MKLFKILEGIASWVLLLFCLPFILFFVLLFIYRFLVTEVLRRLFRQYLIEPLVSHDFWLSGDHPWKKPLSAHLSLNFVDGDLDLNLLRQKIHDTLEGKRQNQSGCDECNYERLTSIYPTFWMGYPFWKRLEARQSFDLDKHIKILPLPQTDGKVNMDEFMATWLLSPFEKDRPLWDIVIASEFEEQNGEKRSFYGFRIHHMIGDAVSSFQFIHSLYDDPPQYFVAPSKEIITTSEHMRNIFWFPLMFLQSVYFNILRRRHFFTWKPSSDIFHTNTTVDLSHLKTIRQNLSKKLGMKMDMLTVLLHLFGRVLKRVIVNDLNQTEYGEDMRVPCSVPRKTRHLVRTICNHWDHGMFLLPLLDAKDSLQNLRRMIQDTQWMVETNAFAINTWVSNCLQILPRCLFLATQKLILGSSPVGDAAGPQHKLRMFGKDILEKRFMSGIHYKQQSMRLICCSYSGKMSFNIISNRNIFSQEIIRKFLTVYMQEEIQHLLEESSECMVGIEEPV